MNPFKKVAKNWFVLLFKSLFLGIWSLFITAFMARHLGVTNYGILTFALTFVSLFAILGNVGIYSLMVREIARDKSQAQLLIGDALILRFFLSLLTVAIIIAINNFCFSYERIKNIVLYIAAFSLVFENLSSTFTAVFEGFQKMEYDAFTSFFIAVFQGILIISVLFIGWGVIGVIWVYLVGSFVDFLLRYFLCNKSLIRPTLTITSRIFFRIKKMLREAIPFALTAFFVMLLFKMDIIMISFIKGDAEVGLYSAAAKLVYKLLIIATTLSISVYPALSELLVKDKKQANKLFQLAFYVLIVIGVPIAIGGMVISDKIIHFLFGKQYVYSSSIFKIIIWYVPLCFIASLLANSLNAANKQAIVAKVAFSQVLFNLFLNLMLIPRFGGVGAAWATVLTETLPVLVFPFFLRPEFYLNFDRLSSIFLLNALFAFIIRFLRSSYFNLFFLIFASVIIYGGLLFSFRVLKIKDIFMIKSLLFKKEN